MTVVIEDHYDLWEGGRGKIEFSKRSDRSRDNFLMDVTFECHDKEVAELVRNRFPRYELLLGNKSAHTLQAYMFLSLDIVSI